MRRAALNLLQRGRSATDVSTILVFEGWDAAGKGGAIRRVTAALDARDYHVIPIAAPTDEERAHHYLWRFWRHLPRAGRVTIFDRSWYGRVLVERVEGFATRRRVDARLRARSTTSRSSSSTTASCWSSSGCTSRKDEQLRRFKERERSPFKQLEAHRRRLAQPRRSGTPTSRPSTTWSSAPARGRRRGRWSRPTTSTYARIKVLQTACDRLRQALDNME